MKATGIVRRIDELGRIVIPKEIRRVLRIREGDPIEIFTDADGVVLKKYARVRELGDYAETYCEALFSALGFTAAVTDTETVQYAYGPLKKTLLHAALSERFAETIADRSPVLKPDGDGVLTDGAHPLRLAAVPIISNGDIHGSVVLATEDPRLRLSETELTILRTAAVYLAKQIQ